MRVAIRCPDCSRRYMVSNNALGKSVVCADKSCATSFVATEIDESDFDIDAPSSIPAKAIQTSTPPAPPPITVRTPVATSSGLSHSNNDPSPGGARLRRWILILTVIAIVEAIAICVLTGLYLSKGSRSSKPNSELPARTPDMERPSSEQTNASSSPNDVFENREFTKVLTNYLINSYAAVKHLRLKSGLYSPVKSDLTVDDLIMEEIRNGASRISIPANSPHLTGTLQDVREIENGIVKCIRLIESPPDSRPQDVQATFVAIESGLSREAPHELANELDEVSRLIETIASKNGISRDQLNRVIKFRANTLDLVGDARKLARTMLDKPLTSSPIGFAPYVHGVALAWTYLPEPSDSLADRKQILDNVNELLRCAHSAKLLYDAANKAGKRLQPKEIDDVLKAIDSFCQRTLTIADELEKQLKDQ